MSSPTPPLLSYTMRQFSSGLQRKYPGWLNPEGKMYQTQNCHGMDGSLKSRNGMTALTTLPASNTYITGLYRAYKGDVYGNKWLVATAGSCMYRYNDLAATWTKIASTLTPNVFDTFCTWRGNLYMADGIDEILEWGLSSTSTAHNLTTAPVEYPGWIDVWKNRLIAFDFASNSSGVQVSTLGDPDTWDAYDYENVPEDMSGRHCYAGCPLGNDEYCVFTENSLTILTGKEWDNFDFNTVGMYIDGVFAPRSLVSFGNFVVWLGKKGIWSFSGGTPELISDSIEDIILAIPEAYRKNAVAVKEGHSRYRISYTPTGATKNTRTLIYDFVGKAWYGPYDIGFSCMTVGSGEGDTGQIWAACSSTGGKVYVLESGGKDISSNVIVDAITPWMVLQASESDAAGDMMYKNFSDMFLSMKASGSYSVSVAYAVDFSTSWTHLVSISASTSGPHAGDFDSTTETGRQGVFYYAMFPDNVCGHVIRLRLSASTSNPLEIYSLTVRGNPAMFGR